MMPRQRAVSHAISRPSGKGATAIGRKSFMARYVFPDGELMEVGRTVSAMQNAGLEVRDVESLREHYGRTLRAWVANLERRRAEAETLVGEARTRIWLLYMAASAVAFERNRLLTTRCWPCGPAVTDRAGCRRHGSGSRREPAPRLRLRVSPRSRLDNDLLEVKGAHRVRPHAVDVRPAQHDLSLVGDRYDRRVRPDPQALVVAVEA